MTDKRPHSPTFITNPFIKKRNLAWTIQEPDEASDIPVDPTTSTSSPSRRKEEDEDLGAQQPGTAAIESGAASVTDHLALFSERLAKHTLSGIPVLPVPSYSSLYATNANSTNGAHFVIHQHDHPIAGTHYDLRLQINETSSASWAIMYGLPGDPNSVRLKRNATETRIHCLWNHLIETASSQTGSLLIWDTGTYSVLPYKNRRDPRPDPSSPTASFSSSESSTSNSPQTLLHDAFQRRKIRLRLHGARLPDPYIVNLRLTKTEDIAGRAKSNRRPTRRRTAAGRKKSKAPDPEETSNDDDNDDEKSEEGNDEDDNPELVPKGEDATREPRLSSMERELREMEDEQVRRTNAYPGATNTIGSVHQRKWYLSLDRAGCGFVEKKRRVWQQPVGSEHPQSHPGKSGDSTAASEESCRLSYPFYVRGSDHERSVVTGRRGTDILRDENVHDFTQRKGWKPVVN